MKQYTCSDTPSRCNRCEHIFPKDKSVTWVLKFDKLFCEECPEYKEFEKKKKTHH